MNSNYKPLGHIQVIDFERVRSKSQAFEQELRREIENQKNLFYLQHKNSEDEIVL